MFVHFIYYGGGDLRIFTLGRGKWLVWNRLKQFRMLGLRALN